MFVVSRQLLRSFSTTLVRTQSKPLQLHQRPQVLSPQTEVTVLQNGIRVCSEDHHLPTCTAGVWIDAGSRFETEANNGVAHFLEHLAFKGTSKRTQLDLEMEVENKGAMLNAYTSRETTVYYAKCRTEDISWSMELLSDILLNSSFEKGAIERERSVILREAAEVAQDMQETVLDMLHEVAYAGSPLSLTILGPEANIKSISRQDLVNYIGTHYKGPRIVISAAGGVDHEALVGYAEKYFGHLGSHVPEHYMTPGVFKSGYKLLEDNKKDMAYCTVAIEGPGWCDQENLVFMVLNSMMGDFDRSRGIMQANSRQFVDASICKKYMPFVTCYKDTGLWGFYFECPYASAGSVLEAIQRELGHYVNNLTGEEVERGKQILFTNMLAHMDGTTAICQEVGQNMLSYGRRVKTDELALRINALNLDIIKRVFRKYMHKRPVAFAALGRCDALPPLDVIESRMSF